MCTFAGGEMAERSIAAVLKTVDLQGSGGSNPSLSAKPFSKTDINRLFRRVSFFTFIGINSAAFQGSRGISGGEGNFGFQISHLTFKKSEI